MRTKPRDPEWDSIWIKILWLILILMGITMIVGIIYQSSDRVEAINCRQVADWERTLPLYEAEELTVERCARLGIWIKHDWETTNLDAELRPLN